MGVMPIPKLVITMALPLMFSLLVQSLYNIVDGIFVGMISEDAFTATALAYPIQLLMVAVSVGTGVGINAVCSRMVGAKQYEDAGKAATTGLILAFIGTAAFMLFGIFLLPLYLNTCSGSEETIEMCGRYLRICTLFCLGVFAETLGQRLLQAVGNTILSMVSLVAGAAANMILDPVLIFLFDMGIEGAAVATVIGQWIGAAVALLLNAKTNHEIRFRFKGFKMEKSVVKSIYMVGLPTIFTQAMGSVMMFSMNAILGALLREGADSAITFFGAYYKLQNFLYMPIMGLGQAVIPIIGFNFGAGNSQRIKAALKTAVPLAIGIAAVGTALFETVPAALLRIFSVSDGTLAVGVPGLRVIAATFVFGSITIVLGYACSGLGNGVVNMIGTLLRQFIPLVPLAWLLGKLGGVNMIWYAFILSELLGAVYVCVSAKREFAKKLTRKLQ